MAEKKEEYKFPTEVIDLPSRGKLYPKDSPLSSGKVELRYMTAKEEDILTSQNLIKKGVVIDKVIESLLVDKSVKVDDMVLGDKNAVMVATRILAYGPEYTVEIQSPTTGETVTHTFNLADCPFKELSDDTNGNSFECELPTSKVKIGYKILTGRDENNIESQLNSMKKIGSQISPELTTRLKTTIISVDGETDQKIINGFVDNMLSIDSLYLRSEMATKSPDIELKQEVDIGGETVEVEIPMTVEFFWPKA